MVADNAKKNSKSKKSVVADVQTEAVTEAIVKPSRKRRGSVEESQPVVDPPSVSKKNEVNTEALVAELATIVPKSKKVKIVLKEQNLQAHKKVKEIENHMEPTSSVEPEGLSIDDIPDVSDMMIMNALQKQPEGIPKSGRNWKPKQVVRHSAMLRRGISSGLSKTQARHASDRARKEQLRELEAELKQERKDKEAAVKEEREEKSKRRLGNQYKSSEFQVINPEKMKSMSKKQLRMIRKTSVGKHGQIELVPVY
jgi:hypothetical protein